MDENLKIPYNHCIFHLDSIHLQGVPNLHFEHNGGRSWIYSRLLPHPLNFEILDQPVTDSMLILQVVGEISSIETVPTAEREGQDEVGNDGVHVACWVEPRSDTASRTLWGRIRQSLDGVAEATDVKLNFSQLFAVDEVTGVPRLKVAWMPSQDVSTHQRLWIGYLSHVKYFSKPHYPSSVRVIPAVLLMFLTGSLYRFCSTWNMGL
jgi:hypothetical protein